MDGGSCCCNILLKIEVIFVFLVRIHPRDKQDVAYRLTLGARAVAYGEQDLLFRGPFPQLIWASETFVEINYDQLVSVRPFKDVFEVRVAAWTESGHLLWQHF